MRVAQEPERVVRHAVHPRRFGRRRGGGVVERVAQDVRRAEDGEDRARLGVRVAHPHEAVALDAVPEEVLAAEVDRAHGRLPDAVEAFVGRAERPHARHRAHEGDRAHEFKRRLPLRQQVDAHEAETRVADLQHAEVRQLVDGVAHGVVVRRPLLADIDHRLADGLAEADADPRAVREFAVSDLEAAVELAPEVEEHARRVAVVHERAAARPEPGLLRHLPVLRRQQARRVLDRRARPVGPRVRAGPHDPRRRHVGAHARIDLVRHRHPQNRPRHPPCGTRQPARPSSHCASFRFPATGGTPLRRPRPPSRGCGQV